MPIDIKDGVTITMTPAIALIVQVVDEVLHEYDLHAFITSGSDGRHSPSSFHQYNRAVDFRSWTFPVGKFDEVINKMKDRLGSDFDVVVEDDHLHVEYDPKVKPKTPLN